MMRALAIALLTATASCGGGNSAPTLPDTPARPVYQVPVGLSPLLTSMYQQLPTVIASSLADLQRDLPNNQHIASYISAKIAMLQRPTLAVEIADGRMFAEVTSINEGSIAIATLFPEERMRAEAMQTLTVLQQSLPILERFLDTSFPTASIRVWYGFKVGNSGGGGTISSEDRTSYDERTPVSRLPFESILCHELAHSYIGNEILTQFLELYTYNRLHGSTPDLTTWSFTRGYAGPSDANRDVALVLDVYQLLGHDAMARAYKAAYALRPPYGSPLSPAVRQAFVDQAPEELKALVETKLSRITF